jgi:hypothetical protein
MSTNPSAAAGQVSADGQFRWDGQQWVPIAQGTREPTPWTRPMQLAAAGLFAVEAVYSIVVTLLFVNHDSMLKALNAQGTQLQTSGTSIDTVINFAIAGTIAVVVFFAVCQLVAAAGSYFGWRWMFWAAFVLFGLGGLGAFTDIPTLFRPDTSPIPLPGVLISELLAVVSLAIFVWMLIGVIRFGPWAMKKPGT